jgi:hypothetical protein
VNVPKSSIKLDVRQIDKPQNTNWIAIIALVFSLLSFFWIELKTNRKENNDKKNSKNDLF